MNLNAMNLFLSEENIKRHLEHLRTQKLKYSILEKSVPELKGKSIKEILRSGAWYNSIRLNANERWTFTRV